MLVTTSPMEKPMITCFPELYPDELFYSGCARYRERVRYPTGIFLREELFGTASFITGINFPTRLDNFISRLAPEHYLTSDTIIAHHTMLPLFSPFVPQYRVAMAQTALRGQSRTPVHVCLYGPGTPSLAVQRMRFCVECVKEDRQQYGETYWHRVHQVPGVLLCPLHSIPLSESDVQTRSTETNTMYVAAEQAVSLCTTKTLHMSHALEQVLFNIARDAQSLLDNALAPDLEIIYKRYLTLLADRGLAGYSGNLRIGPLLTEFINFFSEDGLSLIGCTIAPTYHKNWLVSMLRPSTADRVNHPLRHLLLIQFLGHTVETFFSYLPTPKPFGNGPWICHNPFCSHYQQKSITQVDLTYREERTQVTGFFACECGFIYNRTGPDRRSEDENRIGQVVSYGDLWEGQFRQIWNNANMSRKEVVQLLSHRIGLSPSRIHHHAKRLGLIGTNQHSEKVKDEQLSKEEKQSKHRSIWLELLREYPHAGMYELSQICAQTYYWLYSYDHDWLEEHRPKQKLKQPRTQKMPLTKDWARIDVQLADQVYYAVTKIKKTTPPIRVSHLAIAREIGELNRIQNTPKNLPLTKSAISACLEPNKDFQIRKIKYAQSLYLEEGIIPTRIEFLRRAQISGQKHPQLRHIIDDALQILAENISIA